MITMKLRPKKWEEYVGHQRQVMLIRRLVDKALEREEVADHILLHGPPGLGKTVMAALVQETIGAAKSGSEGKGAQATSSMSAAQMQAVLTDLYYGESLFVDEIHSLKPATMESIQMAMEGAIFSGFRTAFPFMLLGATTKYGKLPNTLRDRFGLVIHLDYYDKADIGKILAQSAEKLDMTLRPDPASEIALRSRGVPRIANRLLRRIRDVTDEPKPKVVKQTLAELGVDSWGLDDGDRGIVMLLFSRFNGGPVGVRTLAAASGLEEKTLVEAFEPFLLRLGLLDIVPRGRQLSQKGFTYCQQIDRIMN